jgi:hypothetical protein
LEEETGSLCLSLYSSSVSTSAALIPREAAAANGKLEWIPISELGNPGLHPDVFSAFPQTSPALPAVLRILRVHVPVRRILVWC